MLIEKDALFRLLLFEPHQARSLLTGDAVTARDWQGVPERACREGVAGILFYHLRKYDLIDLCPADTVNALAQQYHTQVRRNLRIIAGLREILALFRQEHLPCIVLKGIALAERVYPHIALRGMSDVDLLIQKGDLFRADTALLRLGYTSQDSTADRAVTNPPGYLASLEYRKRDGSGLNLHLHWHPVNTSVPATAFAERIDLVRLWEMAQPARIADSETLMLCPEHLIIYLCEHALRVGHGFDRLILVCDLYFAIKSFAGRIRWEEVGGESRRWHLDRLVYHALVIVKDQTGLTAMEGCLADLSPTYLTIWERLFFRSQQGHRRIRGSAYFLHLALHQGLLAKGRFVARTLFPPRQILRQRRAGEAKQSALAGYGARIGEVYSHFWRALAIGRKGPPDR